jgi:hypothetical protein
MKYRTREFARRKKSFRKMYSKLQSKGFQVKMRPRWRQIKKARAKIWKSMDI